MYSRVIIKTGYTCNNDCLFCHAKGKREYPNLKTGEIKKKIMKAKMLGIDMIVLSGGEPTIRPDIMEIARFVQLNGMELGLISNGRMLSYDSFFKQLYERGLRYVYVSLHGDERAHNIITKTDSFQETLEGIINVSKSDSELIVNCVVTKKNTRCLKKIVDVLKNLKVSKLKYSFPEPIESTENRRIIPDISDSAAIVKDAIDYGRANGLSMGLDGFPLCLIGGYEGFVDDLKTNKIFHISESFEDGFSPADFGNTIKLGSCGKCMKKDRCPGIFREYLKLGYEKIPMRAFVV